jgi:hypothetical protein
MSLDTGRTLRELAWLQARHRLQVDRARVNRFLARQCLKTGDHREALRLLALAAGADGGRDGVAAIREDLAMLWRHATEGARRRLGVDSPRRRQRRHTRQRQMDPHLGWKAEAQAWLDELTGAATGRNHGGP